MKRTVSDMIKRYVEETLPYKPKNKDQNKIVYQLKWWKDEIEIYKLANITPTTIVEARTKLRRQKTHQGDTRCPATVNRYLTALSHVFKTAMKEWSWITDSINQSDNDLSQ